MTFLLYLCYEGAKWRGARSRFSPLDTARLNASLLLAFAASDLLITYLLVFQPPVRSPILLVLVMLGVPSAVGILCYRLHPRTAVQTAADRFAGRLAPWLVKLLYVALLLVVIGFPVLALFLQD